MDNIVFVLNKQEFLVIRDALSSLQSALSVATDPDGFLDEQDASDAFEVTNEAFKILDSKEK